jgi:hypothetical protein
LEKWFVLKPDAEAAFVKARHAKGMAGTLGENATGTAWFLLGLLNLVAALGTLLLLVNELNLTALRRILLVTR